MNQNGTVTLHTKETISDKDFATMKQTVDSLWGCDLAKPVKNDRAEFERMSGTEDPELHNVSYWVDLFYHDGW